MRFLKLADKERGDLVHIWLEDECPPQLAEDLEHSLRTMAQLAKKYTTSVRSYKLDYKLVSERGPRA